MNHKDLDAWRQSMDLVEQVYRATAMFPKEELYGLTAQIRRATVSVPSNLSEGAARPGRKEFLMFIGYASGSLAELETQFSTAQRLGYCAVTTVCAQIDRVRALVLGLRRSLLRSDA